MAANGLVLLDYDGYGLAANGLALLGYDGYGLAAKGFAWLDYWCCLTINGYCLASLDY